MAQQRVADHGMRVDDASLRACLRAISAVVLDDPRALDLDCAWRVILIVELAKRRYCCLACARAQVVAVLAAPDGDVVLERLARFAAGERACAS